MLNVYVFNFQTPHSKIANNSFTLYSLHSRRAWTNVVWSQWFVYQLMLNQLLPRCVVFDGVVVVVAVADDVVFVTSPL